MSRGEREDLLPLPAQFLAQKGPRTREALVALARAGGDPQVPLPGLSPANRVAADAYAALADAFHEGWEDEPCAEVLEAITEWLSAGNPLDAAGLRRWTRAHPNQPKAVIDCLRVDPPRGVAILQVLSRAGSQKMVFLANWELAQREVVLKRFIGADVADRLLTRELQPHPLNMAHPNIIETHQFQNSRGEPFVVERRLHKVLDDAWDSEGILEAANLLRDIAGALTFLEEKALVHGDVKPDNIGYESGRYLLLDFGICRPAARFAEEPTATGSLRTRAPEVLLGEGTHTAAADVWALGATVFHAVHRRFPLYQNEREAPPPIARAADRAAFEDELRRRVADEWERYVDASAIPEPLRGLLASMLDRDPARRTCAAGVLAEAEHRLSAYLRPKGELPAFSPVQTLDQLLRYLPPAPILRMMPYSERQELAQAVHALRAQPGIDADLVARIERLCRDAGILA